ncbi:MAG TPA: hypothetical protein VGK73_11355 [Polyangiaceae bacterium]
MSTIYAPQQPLLASDLRDGTFPDPVRLVLLDLFRAAIINRFSLTWATVVAEIPGLSATTSAVEDFYLAPLTEQLLQERKFAFPFLLFDRVGTAEYADATLTEEKTTQQWDLHWIVGPLRIGELYRLRSALNKLLPDLIKDVCGRGGVHPAYNDGQSVFGPGGIPLGSMRLVNHNADALPVQNAGNVTLYHGVTMRIETTEFDAEPVDAYPTFLTAAVSIAVGGYEGLIPDFIKREVKIKG